MNDFKKRLSESTNKVKEENKVTKLIMEFYRNNGQVTEEKKQEILKIDKKELPDEITLHVLLDRARSYIEKGEVDEEEYKECMKIRCKRITLEQLPDEKEKEEENENEPEI